MKKILFLISFILISLVNYGQSIDTLSIDEITVVSFYRNSTDKSSIIDVKELIDDNYGQEPSHYFSEMPSIFSLSDNGTEFGYGYFRIRGLDQTRVNVTIDGCPWNEAEDFGTYFANSPDLMSSLKSIKLERGSSSSYNGIAGSAGGINMESVDVFSPLNSYIYLGAGSFESYKTSIIYNMAPKNNWGLHVKATHQETDGFREYGFNDSKAVTIKTGYKFNNRHSIDFLTLNGYHENGQGWIGATYNEIVNKHNINGNTEKEDDEWFMSMNRVLYKGVFSDNIILTSSIYGQFQDGSYRMDLDNYMRRMVDKSWETTDILYDYGLTHYMVGFNIFSKFYLNKVTLTVGINDYTYKRNHFMDDKCINVPYGEYYSNYGRKNDMSGIFNVSYKPYKNFNISGNIQYRNVKFIYKDTEKYGNPNGGIYSFEKNWDFVNFGGSIEYSPLDKMNIYTRFNYLNREPTRSDMFGGSEYYCGDLVTTIPEISKDLEIGVDFNTSDKLSINFNAFYMWFKNELVLNGEYGPNGLPCHENAQNSFRRGIELSTEWNVYSNLFYTLNGSLSENKVKTKTFGNKTHILSPSSTLFTEISWRDKIWEVGASITYRDEMFVDMENNHKLPSSVSYDAYAKLKFKKFEFCALFNGIGDKDDLDFCTGMIGADGELLYIQNAPFSINCSLKYFF